MVPPRLATSRPHCCVTTPRRSRALMLQCHHALAAARLHPNTPRSGGALCLVKLAARGLAGLPPPLRSPSPLSGGRFTRPRTLMPRSLNPPPPHTQAPCALHITHPAPRPRSFSSQCLAKPTRETLPSVGQPGNATGTRRRTQPGQPSTSKCPQGPQSPTKLPPWKLTLNRQQRVGQRSWVKHRGARHGAVALHGPCHAGGAPTPIAHRYRLAPWHAHTPIPRTHTWSPRKPPTVFKAPPGHPGRSETSVHPSPSGPEGPT